MACEFEDGYLLAPFLYSEHSVRVRQFDLFPLMTSSFCYLNKSKSDSRFVRTKIAFSNIEMFK